MSPRRSGLLAVFLLLFVSVALTGLQAQNTEPTQQAGRLTNTRNFDGVSHVLPGKAQPPNVSRIIVKLRAPLATQVESSLSAALSLSPGSSAAPSAANFVTRHPIRSMSPLYPAIVRMKKSQQASDQQLAAGVARRFAARASRLHAAFTPPDLSRTYALELQDGANPDEVLASLHSDPEVEFAEPDQVFSVALNPNDPYLLGYGSWGQPYNDLWGVLKIGAPTAWDTATGRGILVAVVDTGLDYNHPDISANVWTNSKEIPGNGIDDDRNGYIDDVRGWNYIANTNDPLDDNGHGTHVAGTIAATGNNGLGVIGVAWQATVMPVKAFDSLGYSWGSVGANAIVYAANSGADVISNSWVGPPSQALAEAVDYAYSLGAVVVAAAGNDSHDARDYYPAALWNVITVAASDPWDSLAQFSNYGPKIDVAAPGVDILSLRASGTGLGLIVGNDYVVLSGTSMATPHVSGAAALVLSQHPEFSNEDVRQVLRTSALDLGAPGLDSDFGYGRINLSRAVTVTSVLEAKISSPQNGYHVTGNVVITGVARGAGLTQYKLEYGAGRAPSAWTVISSGTTSVSGTLGALDCSVLPDGAYTIRLTAIDAANQVFIDQTEIYVSYLAIGNPPPPTLPVLATVVKPGVPITITGAATGATFQRFRIDWARGQNPSSGWSSTGVTLAGGGSAPTQGELGTWDTSSITQADYYTIRLSVDNAGFTSETRTLVYLEPDLISGNWPKWLDTTTLNYSGVVPTVDQSGKTLLTYLSPTFLGSASSPRLRMFSPDGSVENSVPMGFGGYFQPAFGPFGTKPKSLMADARQILGLNADATTFTLPVPLNVEFQFSQIVLDDLDGDSLPEAITIGREQWNNRSHIFAWRADRQLMPKFPVTFDDQSGIWPSSGGLAVGDIDGDGNKEIVVLAGVTPDSFTLRLFAHDGSSREWAAPVFHGGPDQMILVDFDHDGKLEIVVTSATDDFSQVLVHVLQADGSERPGWPINLGRRVYSYLAAADLARDGREQLIVSNDDKLYVFNADGTTFSSRWPQVSNSINMFGPVVVADVDGDGDPEILVTRGDSSFIASPTSTATTIAPRIDSVQGTTPARVETSLQNNVAFDGFYWTPTLLAYHRDGTVVKSWRLLGMNGQQPFYAPRLTVGDFDRNGIVDIAVLNGLIYGGGYNGWINEGVLTVLSTGAPVNPDGDDWPMNFQNTQNAATLRRTVKTTTSAASSLNPSVFGQQLTLSAQVNPASANAVAPTGTVHLIDGETHIASCVLSSNACSMSISGLSSGLHNWAVNYAGDTTFGVSTSTLVQTVNKAVTSISLSSDSNTSLVGAPVNLTASLSVLAPGAGTPTGTVTFYDGASSLGSASPDASGRASLTVTTLAQGDHTLSASYNGDNNFLNAGSATIPHPVIAPDFTLAASSAETVNAGTPASYTINVAPNPAPYDHAVTNFACSGLPAATTCTFTPTSVTPGSDPTTVTLSIKTTARTTASLHSNTSQQFLVLWFGLGMAGVAGMCRLGKQKKFGAVLLLFVLGFISSCGGGGGGGTQPPPPVSGTPAGAYTITITAIGNGSTTHTVDIALTVK